MNELELKTRNHLIQRQSNPFFIKSVEKQFLKEQTAQYINYIEQLDSNNDAALFLRIFSDWLKSDEDLLINYWFQPQLDFQLLNSSFSLVVNMDIVQNELDVCKQYPKVIQLNNIVSSHDNTGVGKKFILRLEELSVSSGLPIMLYCSSEMIMYYKNIGFEQHGYGDDGTCRMFYIPVQSSSPDHRPPHRIGALYRRLRNHFFPKSK